MRIVGNPSDCAILVCSHLVATIPIGGTLHSCVSPTTPKP